MAIATASAAAIAGCAGPATPIGAVWALTPSEARARAVSRIEAAAHAPSIRFNPSQQILHGPFPLKIVIDDARGDLVNYEVSVRYNGLDVSRSFLRTARITPHYHQRRLVIESAMMRLTATEEHDIEVVYHGSTGASAFARYEAPVCYGLRPAPVRTYGDFEPGREVIRWLGRISRRASLNPAFFTALVAQESGFDPSVVSWAKALGLTQITTVAETEVSRKHPEWPRYPGIEGIPVPAVKMMVTAGLINAGNEWRLDEEHSLEGGAGYVRYLSDRWSSDENQSLLKGLFTDSEAVSSQLVLASYHSGYARVSGALHRLGRDWIKAPELQEARKYVNRIFSLCHYFAEGEDTHETET